MIFGHSTVVVEKDTPGARWCVLDGHGGVILFVPYRLATNGLEGAEEIAAHHRYPMGDVRRYDRDRLIALELCLVEMPLTVDEGGGGARWRPLLLNEFDVAKVPDPTPRRRVPISAIHDTEECSTTDEQAVRPALRRRLL